MHLPSSASSNFKGGSEFTKEIERTKHKLNLINNLVVDILKFYGEKKYRGSSFAFPERSQAQVLPANT
jgi:hypothetical protein